MFTIIINCKKITLNCFGKNKSAASTISDNLDKITFYLSKNSKWRSSSFQVSWSILCAESINFTIKKKEKDISCRIYVFSVPYFFSFHNTIQKKTRVDTINRLGTVVSYTKGTKKNPCIFNDKWSCCSLGCKYPTLATCITK